ncbi:phage virion morphogenesis protein [Sphingomonas sp. PP-F2F-A104-K0414]|uniref:phage virion morphogenesis protein n=1 Tax=Sphingomonas sp. PP-F2F-A104-K0414 TaxID=2135661 RepID=UPI00104786E7|nr:phage virion morphogenesis protein [Sphingomonas sp. PP-F2F-A104-K0414]TCP95282.1 phage virion morphogenesis protein [Sphingomonas sp. PP-F2F-A104-K0414]
MTDDLAQIEQLAGALLRRVDSGERRKILRLMARTLQRSQSARIARQQNPDGQPYAARKAQPAGRLRRKGTIKRKAMFRKLRNAPNLQAGSTDTEAWVGFSGRAAQIARVHQEGLEDAPVKGRKPVRYAQRILLGDTKAERQAMLDIVFRHIDADVR